MPACPACDATLPGERRACPECGTHATFSFETARGSIAQATRALDAARTEVGLLRASGVEPSIAERLIDKADGQLRLEHAPQALAYAQAARRAAGIAKTRGRIREDLARAEESVRLAKESGAETAAAERALKEAGEKLAARNLKSAETWLRKVSIFAEEGTRVKSAESYLKSAEKAIRYARERGADVTEAQAEYAKAEDALRAKSFDAAKEAATRAREAAERARKFSRYEKFVVSAERNIEAARKTGADLSAARQLASEARRALKGGQFADAQTKAGQTKEAVAEAKRYRTAELILGRAEKAARKEERKGVDVSGPGLMLGEARTALEGHDYRKVRDLAREAREALKEAIIVRRLRATLTTLVTDVQELKQIGGDAAEAEPLLAEANVALEARDFDKCRRLVERCRRATDDAREARRQELIISTIQKIVEAAAGRGRVDAEQIRGLIQDVDAMLAGGEAVDVESLVSDRLQVVDAGRLRELDARLADVRGMLLELKAANIDIMGAEEIVAQSQKAIEAGRVDEAERRATELQEMARNLMETLRASAKEGVERARASADRARKANIPIPDAIRMLNSAEAALEQNKPYEAIEFARIAQMRADAALKTHQEELAKMDIEKMQMVSDRVRKARERIDNLAGQIEYLTGVGVDVTPARDSLGNAQRALQDKRVEELEAHLLAAEQIVEGMRVALRQSASDSLARLRKNVEEARSQNLLTAEMEAVMARAEEAFKEDRYREALEAIRALEEAIQHARDERANEQRRKEMERERKAMDRIARVRRMVEELRKANIDIQGAEESLLDAEKALQEHDYDSVDAILADLESTAREMRAELLAATRFIVAKAGETIDDAERRGLNMNEPRLLLENARQFLDRGKLDEAVEAANTARQRADAASRLKSEEEARAENLRIETARQKIERLRATLDDLRRADITVDGAEDALQRAEEALAAKRYDEVHAVLAETEALADTLQEGLRTAAEQLLDESRKNVEAAKQEGLNVRRADMVITNASEAIQHGRYVEAIEYHKVIDDIVGDAKRMREFRELETEVQVLRADLARAAALGGDIRASEDLLHKAQEEVALGRYDRVAEYTQEARERLTVTRRQILEGRLDRARIAIGKAEMLGVDPVEAKALLPDAEKAAEEGNFDALDLLVRKIEEKAAQASGSHMAAKAEEDFLAVEELASHVTESGMDVPEARRFLEEARKLRQERDFESMSQAIAEARRLFEQGSHDHIVKTCRDKMDGLAAMLETARRIGANVAEPERMLAEAERALVADDVSLADLLVKQAEVSTGVQIQSFIQNKYPNLILKLPKAGLQEKTWNKYVLEIENKGAIGAKNVEVALDGDVEVRGLEPIPAIEVDEKKVLEIGVKPKHDGDVPLGVHVHYERHFDANRYESKDAQTLKVEPAGTYLVEDVFLIHTDGRLITHESRKFRQEIDEDIFSGMLTVVQDFIRDAFRDRTQTGLKRLDFGRSKILIERSRHCYLSCIVLGDEPALLPLYMAEMLREIEARFGNRLEGWSGMLLELEGVDEIIRRLVLVTAAPTAARGALEGSDVASVQQLLDTARQEGAEISEVETLLAQAESSLETDMELAWQLLGKAKQQAVDSKQRFQERMKKLVDETEQAVAEIRALGADVGPLEILVREAREALEAGRFEKVEEIASNVRATLERMQRETATKEVEGHLNDLIQEIEKARSDGVDVTRAEAFLVRIEEALQRRNFRAVDDHLRKAREALQEERRSSVTKRSVAEMERLTRLFAEAKQCGLEMGDAESLLLRAQEARTDGRIDDLDALVRQASLLAKHRIEAHLEDKFPRLFFTAPPGGLQKDAWNAITIEVANRGNWSAKDVRVGMAGDFEVRGLKPVERIDPNDRKQLAVGVRPRRDGPLAMDIAVQYHRPLDEKTHETTDTREVRVEPSGTYLVEDVFLIHTDGRLIAHESRRHRDAVDEDIFSGMLTVVLNYVKESFRQRAGGGLRRLDFGENVILFEKSPHVYLASTIRGGEPVVLPIYMVDALQEIEDRFGEILERWSGFLTELVGVEDVVRRLLYVTETPQAFVGPLENTPIAEAMRLVSEAAPEEPASDFVQEARTIIEAKDFAEASDFVRKTIRSYTAGREELHAQLRDAVITHGAATGLRLTDEQMKKYIDVVHGVVDAILAAREKAGMDKVWPVKRVAVKVENEDSLDAVTSFRKIITNQALSKELDIVPPGETWRGLTLDLQLDSEAISKAYRLWARKIEILLRSQDAWRIKQGLDKGEYNVGVDGQKVRIDPSMVWFTETVPENVIEERFEGGTVYLDTEVNDEILAEGYARELVNIIRDVRSELKLPGDVWIETKVRGSETLGRLLKKWKDFISHETNSQVVRFVRGELTDGYVVECNLGQESFSVSVRPAEGAVAEI